MATNHLENIEKPGKLREFEKLSKSQGNLNFYRKKPGKLRENIEYVLREKFENDLEISGKVQGILSLKNVATLIQKSNDFWQETLKIGLNR